MLVDPVINCSLTISVFPNSCSGFDQSIINFLGHLHLLGFTKFSVLFYTRDFTWFLTHKLLFACKAIPGQDTLVITDYKYILLSRQLGAGRWHTVFKVLVPGMLPG